MGESYHQRRRRKDPARVRRIERNSYLKAAYGITLEQYEDMIEDQSYLCKTCWIPLHHFKNVCVDHCHKTGKVRGVLCGNCNKALGLVRDDTETLGEMIEYIR